MCRVDKKIVKYLPAYLQILLGSAIAALALDLFMVPVHTMDGGITGVAMILNHLTGFKLGLLIIVLNIPFIIVGLKQLGKRFVCRMLVGVISYAIFSGMFEGIYEVTYDSFLACIIGGIILGIGCGMVIRAGGCLDGTEVVAIIVDKNTIFSVGQAVLCFNVILYVFAGLLFGWDKALYSLITYLIVSKVEDMIINGLDSAKACFIITEESANIAQSIYTQLGRTVTIMEGTGLVSGSKVVLYCVITRMEVPELEQIVEDDDASAFVTVSDVSDVIGKHVKKKSKKVIREISDTPMWRNYSDSMREIISNKEAE